MLFFFGSTKRSLALITVITLIATIIFTYDTFRKRKTVRVEVPEKSSYLPNCIRKLTAVNDIVVKADTIQDKDSGPYIVYLVRHINSGGQLVRVKEYRYMIDTEICWESGTDSAFYANGQLKTVREYWAGTLFGALEHYTIDGDSLYPGDVFWSDGFFIDYYDDGTKAAEGAIKHGFPDGRWTYFYPSGNLKAEVPYFSIGNDSYFARGVHGDQVTYDINGRLTQKCMVDSGTVKVCWDYDSSGNVIKEHNPSSFKHLH